MTSRSPRKKIEKSRYSDFLKVARNFSDGAKLASDYNYYNAAGVLIVHSAIAYSDAICIRIGGIKVSGDNHYEIISVLKDIVLDSPDKKKAINHLKSIIDHKNKVSYFGDIYNKRDIDSLWKHFEIFKEWALSILV